MTRPTTRHPILLAAGLAGLLLAAPAASEDTFGYFRTVDGYAALWQSASDTEIELEANYPLLAGDRLTVSRLARVEALLPDGGYLRLGGGAELLFEELATGETAPQTRLTLIDGELQLVVPPEAEPWEALRIDTVNATVYLPRSGVLRVSTDGSWTEVVVREGYAEVATRQGSALVRSGERVVVDGVDRPRVALEAAPPLDGLERWGEELFAAAGEAPYVEPELAYAASSLDDHGEWIYVENRRAWRPWVGAGWRPYHDGWWTYTPAGLTWVSYEPWGWVPYHYGAWDWASGFGWVWYPGPVFAPARVFWYWGPTYVAWVPIGYYHSFYAGYYGGWGFGHRWGIYGWAGGHGHYFADWTFCRADRFGHRGSRAYLRTGADLTRSGELREVPRGILTGDTRALTPKTWRKPQEAMAALQASYKGDSQRGGLARAGEMPDVTDFVAKRRDLSETTRRAVMPPDESKLGRRGSGVADGRSGSGSEGREPGKLSGWQRPTTDRPTASDRPTLGGRPPSGDRPGLEGKGEPGAGPGRLGQPGGSSGGPSGDTRGDRPGGDDKPATGWWRSPGSNPPASDAPGRTALPPRTSGGDGKEAWRDGRSGEGVRPPAVAPPTTDRPAPGSEGRGGDASRRPGGNETGGDDKGSDSWRRPAADDGGRASGRPGGDDKGTDAWRRPGGDDGSRGFGRPSDDDGGSAWRRSGDGDGGSLSIGRRVLDKVRSFRLRSREESSPPSRDSGSSGRDSGSSSGSSRDSGREADRGSSGRDSSDRGSSTRDSGRDSSDRGSSARDPGSSGKSSGSSARDSGRSSSSRGSSTRGSSSRDSGKSSSARSSGSSGRSSSARGSSGSSGSRSGSSARSSGRSSGGSKSYGSSRGGSSRGGSGSTRKPH